MSDVDLEGAETQLTQAYMRTLQSVAREHIHPTLLELDAKVPKGLA